MFSLMNGIRSNANYNVSKNRNLNQLGPMIDQAVERKSLVEDLPQNNPKQLTSSISNKRDDNETDLNIENIDDVSKYQTMNQRKLVPLFHQPSSKNLPNRRSFRLNLGGLERDSSVQSIVPNSKEQQSQTARYDELNALYKSVSQVVRTTNQVGQILVGLLNIAVKEEQRQQLRPTESEQLILSQQLIIPTIMSIVVMKSHRKIRFDSEILSSSIILINQFTIKPALSIPFCNSTLQRGMKEHCDQLQSYVASVPQISGIDSNVSERMMQLRQTFSQSLAYDITNHWPSRAQLIQEELSEAIFLTSALQRVDCLKVRKGEQQRTYPMSGNRGTLINYEFLQMKELMSHEYGRTPVRNQLVVHSDRPTTANQQLSDNWFHSLKHRISGSVSSRQEPGARVTSHSVSANTSKVHSLNQSRQSNQPWIDLKVMPETSNRHSDSAQRVRDPGTPLKQKIQRSIQDRNQQEIKSKYNSKFNKASQPQQQQLSSLMKSGDISSIPAIPTKFTIIQSSSTLSKITQRKSEFQPLNQPYSQLQQHFKQNQVIGQVAKPLGETPTHSKGPLIDFDSLSENEASLILMEGRLSPRMVTLKRQNQ